METSLDSRAPDPARRPPGRRLVWWLALVASVGAAVAGVVWLTVPGSYPYGRHDIVRTGLNYLIERDAGVVIALTAAAVGLVVAVLGLSRPRSRVLTMIAGIGAGAEALGFAFVLGDGAVMSALGYVVALIVPAAAVVIIVLVARRSPRLGIAIVGGVLLLGVAGAVTGLLGTAVGAAVTYLGNLVTGFGRYEVRLLWALGWLAGAVCWAIAAAGILARGRTAGRTASWARPEKVARWGKVVTVIAALGPIPYGFARLTWLTPWPLGGPGVAELVISRPLDAATRLQGFLFAPAVAVGVILTFGLISRWGEVFPRWIPMLAGRPVPVLLAVIPGGLVATIVTISAPGILLGAILANDPAELAYSLIAFPFPVWGPALGAAVYAYWLRRRSSSPRRSEVGHGGDDLVGGGQPVRRGDPGVADHGHPGGLARGDTVRAVLDDEAAVGGDPLLAGGV